MNILPALKSYNPMPYFVQKAIIKGVQILYQNDFFGYTWDLDLALLLEVYRKDGSPYEYQLNIRGNFKKDHSGNIINWGGTFKLLKLFKALKINGIVNSDGTITQASLDALIDKEVFVLSYISGIKEDGNNKYQMFDILAESKSALEEDFRASLEKGYPKNYKGKLPIEVRETQTDDTNLDLLKRDDFDSLLDL